MKNYETLGNYIDQRYTTRQAFADEIGASRQWVTGMCAKKYIVVDGVIYIPSKRMTKKLASTKN